LKHHIFKEATNNNYSIAILIKATSFTKHELVSNYVAPLIKQGISENNIIAFTLEYLVTGKAPVSTIKAYLGKLLLALQSVGAKYLYVADANYFKVLAGKTKADTNIGYALPCKIKGFEHMTVVLGVNYQALIYNPELQEKLDRTLVALSSFINGTYILPGQGIMHSARYPESLQDITAALQMLHQYPRLTCDIEGFSLQFNEAGIGTIAFAWDKNNGVAFACDFCSLELSDGNTWHGYQYINDDVRTVLKEFFTFYKGELVFHHSPYDAKVIIYALWMNNLLDTKGMLTGLDIITKRMHDTKIIAYLATNSTAGNTLGLKHLAHEFAGNYAHGDIKDIRNIPLPELLEYNLVDALSSHYVLDKYVPIMERDNQGDLYRGLMLDSLKLIIQLELTGMPMSRSKIIDTKRQLELIQLNQLLTINNNPLIQIMNLLVQTKAMIDANAKLKVKQHPLAKFTHLEFNPNSGPQLQVLLYEQMGLPIIDFTDTKMPATGAETIEKLIHHTNEPSYKDLLSALISYGEVTKILNTFIPAFEGAISKNKSDTVWLHGSLNLGGTVSGRLSSSDPNLQNLPAGNTGSSNKKLYGKLIKECFVAPKDWLMCGADFNSLEDMISALTTKDSNKLKVYLDGFDGHSLRAAYYFRDQCPDIDITNPVSVNSIKKKYPALRQDSKGYTFLLTYGGTYHGMMSNLGCPKNKAKEIEKSYHELYKESDVYIQKRLQQASKDGYVEVAFGLRVRTPLLAQVIYGSPKMPYEAAAESRTAGNAMGQSYGLLNNRAAVDFMKKVWTSPYRYDILPIGLIHDAIYILIKDDLKIVHWANNELIKSMQWQDLPEIQHPTVKLGAVLDVFYHGWHQPITLPNNAYKELILKLAREGAADYNKKEIM